MKELLDYSVRKLSDAFSKLMEGVLSSKDELDRDGVIQRFEFTFEQLWKTLKLFLESEGFEIKTPKESLRESFRIGLIENEEVFLNMLEDRNKTSHIYDKETAEEIFERIKTLYVGAIEKVLKKLKENR